MLEFPLQAMYSLRRYLYRGVFREPLLYCCEASLAKTPMVFSINTGRSGSMYLAALLGTATNTISYHEPYPKMMGSDFLQAEREGHAATKLQRAKKIKAIKQAILRYRFTRPWSTPLYCETSNMFVKSFYDVVLEAFSQVKVIRLHRDVAEIVKSLFDAGHLLSWRQAQPWLSVVGSRERVARDVRGVTDDPSSLLWLVDYVVDLEARGNQLALRYPQVPIYPVHLSDLNNPNTIRDLFSWLGIAPTPETFQRVGVPVNSTGDRRQFVEKRIDIDECRAAVNTYREYATQLGVTLPHSPTFNGYW